MNNNGRFRLWHIPVLLLLIVGSIYVIRTHGGRHAIPFQTEEGVIFGTTFHVKYQHRGSLLAEIMQELNAVDASLSMFNPHSTISHINSGQTCETDSLLRQVYLLSRSISEATGGAFDVTVAPLVNAWGFGFKHGELPDSAQVNSLLQIVGWQKTRLQGDSLLKDDARTVIDFSAVAKGFGVDQVASLMRRHNVRNFMVEIGGEVVAEGHGAEHDWRIGIARPDDDSTGTGANKLQEIVTLQGSALATSGNYRNYYIEGGRKIAHTIDPHTGFPAQRDILSSTVMAPSCAMADGYATAFMVMGLQQAQQFLAQHPQLEAYFIYSDEQGDIKTWCTTGFAKLKGEK